ncbi:Hypothetical protein CINCED_3A019295 [Cinara cedri]|uniref:Las1-like n=1 Tax=Cinara cedri TaxID=506608 RepID=A0A5E4MKF5_9HEMI|nr:Hypothetical protein CINCED_3A019295 [Cinara cedri]
MYFRASRLDIPPWLIDMRHKISHDQDLPTLESLRAATEFALKWLKTKYWNNDDNFKVITTKLYTSVTDEFIDILELYMLNKIKTNTIDKEERLNALKTKLSVPSFSYKECIKKIKEFLANKVYTSQLVNAFVTRYLMNAQECNSIKGRISKTDKDVWSVLLKLFTTSGLLTNLLQCLVTQNSRVAALWIIELCIVVFKNSKKIEIKHNENDNCMTCKTLDLDSNLVLRTALNSPHSHTVVFLKWLLRIQSNPLKVKQEYNIVKLVKLYTSSVKINSQNTAKVFTIKDLTNKNSNLQSQWSLALGELLLLFYVCFS